MDDFDKTIARIWELENAKASLVAQLDDLKARVKEHMKAQGMSKTRAGMYNVSYSEYTSHRFDSTRFKAEHKDMYNQYLKAVQNERLTVSLVK